MQQESNFLREIKYTDLDKWYVSFYINPFSLTSIYPLVKLYKLIKPEKFRIAKKEYKGKTSIVSKISFSDGLIHLRPERKTGMDLYKLDKNHLLVSKINFHQGAVAINKINKLVCSTHYQPYKIDYSNVTGDYLILALRSKRFKEFIKYLRADGIKNEATFDFIGNLQIPLPPILIQKRLLKHYNQKISNAEEFEIESNEIEKNIQKYLFEVLGIKFSEKENENKIFKLIDFKDVERWSVDYLSNLNTIKEMLQGKFEPIKFGELINSFQYGLSEKSTKEPVGFPMLRMSNIYDSETVLDDLKYVKIEENTFKKYRLEKGDLLFNRTNSKELVGKTSIFVSDEDYTFASYIIRVKLNKEKVDINYINFLFNSKILQIQKDMISRQILGQANINSIEMQNFLFPIPPLEIQKEITETVQKMKSKIKKLRKQAEANRKHAIKDFEKEIFSDEN